MYLIQSKLSYYQNPHLNPSHPTLKPIPYPFHIHIFQLQLQLQLHPNLLTPSLFLSPLPKRKKKEKKNPQRTQRTQYIPRP